MINYSSDINFRITGIQRAKREGYIVTYVKYPGNEYIYTYVRKFVVLSDDIQQTIIDGVAVRYDRRSLEVISVKRLYETVGRRKRNTGDTGKRYNRSTKSTESKTKEKPVELEPVFEEPTKESIEPVAVKEPAVEERDYDRDIIHHEKYDTIKMCLQSDIPVYLVGPAGSGKNHTIEQIADDLGWEFYFSNSVQQEYKLTGFIDAGGKYHETEFYKACTSKKECVFFLDEMDASIPEVLVLLNAAIANKYFEFPNGRVDIEHVHFIAAGNTVGNGADESYTGRMVLDQATLDRFAIIDFDYSEAIEESISRGNTELINFVHELRQCANRTGIRATFSYRCIIMVTKLERIGMPIEEIMKIAIMKGLDKDTINTFFMTGSTKYHNALKEIQRAA